MSFFSKRSKTQKIKTFKAQKKLWKSIRVKKRKFRELICQLEGAFTKHWMGMTIMCTILIRRQLNCLLSLQENQEMLLCIVQWTTRTRISNYQHCPMKNIILTWRSLAIETIRWMKCLRLQSRSSICPDSIELASNRQLLLKLTTTHFYQKWGKEKNSK